jgi:hypothetical protein
MRNKSKKNKEDLVLAPGGFRSRSSVKHVAPSEAVLSHEDGTIAVVPREQLSDDGMKSERGGMRSFLSSSFLSVCFGYYN